jgi:hypothetical protein
MVDIGSRKLMKYRNINNFKGGNHEFTQITTKKNVSFAGFRSGSSHADPSAGKFWAKARKSFNLLTVS